MDHFVLAQASPGENNSLLFSPNLKWSCIFLHQIDAFFNLLSHKIVFRLIIIQPATIATQIRQGSHQLLYRSSIQDGDLSQLTKYSEILSCSSDVVRSEFTADIHKLIFWACYLSISTLSVIIWHPIETIESFRVHLLRTKHLLGSKNRATFQYQ